MKIISTKTVGGKVRLTIELAPGQTPDNLVEIDNDAFYTLGEPLHEDVIAGYILAGMREVHWCSIEQKWIS
jgi:hypothetical protein